MYFPSDWNNYKIIYAAHARLIDAKTIKVVSEGCATTCRIMPILMTRPAVRIWKTGLVCAWRWGSSIDYCVADIQTKTGIPAAAAVSHVAVAVD